LAALAGEGETGPLALLLDAMDGVRASEGWLHLEVVGSPAAPGPETAATVASYLRDQGAQHIARGEVWDDQGEPGWRVTALIAARKLTPCQRQLFALGASRVVGLPARFVFDRDGHSTFDSLKDNLRNGERVN
jgi:ATP phosphoribosyltransferase